MNQDNEDKYKALEKRFNLVQKQLSILERSQEKTCFSKPTVKKLSTVHKSSQTARLARSGKLKSKSALKVQSDEACSTHFSNIDRGTNTSVGIPTHESISTLNRIIEGQNVKLSKLEGQVCLVLFQLLSNGLKCFYTCISFRLMTSIKIRYPLCVAF